MKIKSLIILILIIFFSSHTGIIFAQQNSPASSSMKVDHTATFIEKVKDKINLFLKFDKKSKVDYHQYLAEKRLAELEYIIRTDQIDSVEKFASKYSTYIGHLTNYTVKNQVKEKKQDIISMFDRHIVVLKKIQTRFEFESGWWLVLQHDVNSAKIFKEKINQI